MKSYFAALLLVLLLLALSASSAPSPKALHDQGLAALRRRSADSAQEALKGLREEYASSGHTHLLAGHCALLLEGNAARAEMLYEQASTAFSASGASDDDEAAEALHAFARLYRQQQRWQESDDKYVAAVALRPDDTALAEEALFVRGKCLLASDEGLKAAVDVFERGFHAASAAWKPHFAREVATAHGLSGDPELAARYYKQALALGALRDHSAIGEALQTLAAHHERHNSDLAIAAAFLRNARDAFASSAKEANIEAAEAAAHLRHAQVSEALYALGERGSNRSEARGSGDDHGDAPSSSAARDALPTDLHPAVTSYERALALAPNLAAAYDGLASLLLGTSRLTNFGATHAAALNVAEAERLLLAGGEAAATERTADGMAAAVRQSAVRSSSTSLKPQRPRSQAGKRSLRSSGAPTKAVVALAGRARAFA